MKTHTRIPLHAVWLSVVLALVCFKADAAVTMDLDQTEIHQGDAAQLTVRSTGEGADASNPPAVPGLDFNAVGQSSQIEIINGSATSSSSVTYEVTAQAPGTYTIPDGSGKNLVLHVLPGSGPGAATASSSPASTLLPAPPDATGGFQSPPDVQGAPFIRMALPRRPLYVGETVPVEIEMGLPADSQPTLDGLPALTADAFTLDKLSDKPEQAEQDVNGQPYLILTWHSALAAIKPGDFQLGLTAPVTIQQREAPRRAAGDDDDDPFFGNSVFQNFFAQTVQKNLTLADAPETIHVLPLPSQGQPAEFSGAVGKFAISSSITPTTAAAGDPLTLRLEIKGAGTFERVSPGMLRSSPDWKTYPPTVKFTPADSVGYQGEKDFEQAVIPLHGGRQIVPALAFTFFNPETRRYETLRTDPGAVDINGSAVPLAQTPTAATPSVASTTSPDGLLPDEPVPGTGLQTLRPLYFSPGYLAGQGCLLLGFLGSGLWLRRRDLAAADTRRLQREAESKIARGFLAEMDTAARRGDGAVFFLSARQALQHGLGWRWNMAPTAVTAEEVERHLHGNGENVRRVFDLADQLAYSHGESVEADFGAWQKTVHQLVKQAETL